MSAAACSLASSPALSSRRQSRDCVYHAEGLLRAVPRRSAGHSGCRGHTPQRADLCSAAWRGPGKACAGRAGARAPHDSGFRPFVPKSLPGTDLLSSFSRTERRHRDRRAACRCWPHGGPHQRTTAAPSARESRWRRCRARCGCGRPRCVGCGQVSAVRAQGVLTDHCACFVLLTFLRRLEGSNNFF